MEILLIIAGIVIGLIISAIRNEFRYVGSLRIDKSDPTENPYLFLEIDKGIGDISNRKYITLKVKREDFIPRK